VPEFVDMKSYKKILGLILSPFTLGLIVTLLITYISLVYYAKRGELTGKEDRGIVSFIQEIHEKTIDWRLMDRGNRPGSDRVAILAIDEKTLEMEGRWPWPRNKLATLIDKTVAGGAKVIAFDAVFSEEDNNSAKPLLERIMRSIKTKPQTNTEVSPLLAQLDIEKTQVDLDHIFGNSIKQNQSHLVLGTYYDDQAGIPPYSEICFQTQFERSFASRYWKSEAIQTTVSDQTLSDLKFPKDFKSHLDQYFTALEVSASGNWFSDHPKVNDKIKTSLDEYAALLDPAVYPAIAVLAINNDLEQAKAMLGQFNPAFSNEGTLKNFFEKFLSGIEKKDQSAMKAALQLADRGYCERFLTDEDELGNLTEYTKIWGDSPEAKEQFKSQSWDGFWLEAIQGEPQFTKKTFADFKEDLKTNSIANALPQALQWQVNIPAVSEGKLHSGYFNALQDPDGNLRRAQLLARIGTSYMQSLPLKAFLVDRGYKAVGQLQVEKATRRGPQLKTLKSLEITTADGSHVMNVPVNGLGNLMINYSGPQHMFPHVSASDIMSDNPKLEVTVRQLDPSSGKWVDSLQKVDRNEFLKDKILFLGATAIGIYDLRVTPFDENFPGVETHANILSNFLVEDAKAQGLANPLKSPGFLRNHPSEEKWMWLVLLVVGVLLAALLNHFGSVAGLAITFAALFLIYLIDKFYLFRSGIVVTIFFPVTIVVANFISLTFYKYFGEERKKRELKGTFEKYVSPAIVAEVLADPSNIELGGKKMELTVMFSDVRGFTTISEKLDPRALSDLLNSYLTPMTDLVFAHKGTLDKYMGDAIMSFWGAPVHFPDHAHHACRCALEMLKKLKVLQAEIRAKNLPEIDIGIGLNTGDMSVGNMGSNTVRSYTVMGDAVNLGSRLEGINKEYGTRIIISEFTFARIEKDFVCREVDWVKVKGKTKPVRIFELIAEGRPDETQEQFLKHYGDAFRLYHEQKFADSMENFKLALVVKGDDALSQKYVERCQEYLNEPPDPEWDGVHTMKTK
jgi:class 3 adenylate cyclase/CHASE2 domain-containing sensor protein